MFKKKIKKHGKQTTDIWGRKLHPFRAFLLKIKEANKTFKIGMATLLIIILLIPVVIIFRDKIFVKINEENQKEENIELSEEKNVLSIDESDYVPMLFNLPMKFSVDPEKKYAWSITVTENPIKENGYTIYTYLAEKVNEEGDPIEENFIYIMKESDLYQFYSKCDDMETCKDKDPKKDIITFYSANQCNTAEKFEEIKIIGDSDIAGYYEANPNCGIKEDSLFGISTIIDDWIVLFQGADSEYLARTFKIE